MRKSSIYNITGLDKDVFNPLLAAMMPIMRKGKGIKTVASALEPREKLMMVLYFLRHWLVQSHYFENSLFPSAPMWGLLVNSLTSHPALSLVMCTGSFRCCVIFLRTWAQFQDWDSVTPGFAGAQFIMDCTSHYRRQVHPGQHLYYRGDKHAHFLTAQVCVSMDGLPYDV